MQKPDKHILLCGSFRSSGESRGVCHKKNSINLVPYLEGELMDRGLDGVFVSLTTCLKVCDRGPAMVIYPDNIWYGGIETEEDIDAILDSLEEGEINEKYLIT
jgi:(2Fe-2S) ferredoxin